MSFLKTKGLGNEIDNLTVVKTLVVFFDVAIDIELVFAEGGHDWFFFDDGFEVTQGVSCFKVFFNNDFIDVVIIIVLFLWRCFNSVAFLWRYFNNVAVNGIGGREIVFETCVNEIFVVIKEAFKLFF